MKIVQMDRSFESRVETLLICTNPVPLLFCSVLCIFALCIVSLDCLERTCQRGGKIPSRNQEMNQGRKQMLVSI
jgi:peptidoglycan/LPS O-acetylase OafA/YrhL